MSHLVVEPDADVVKVARGEGEVLDRPEGDLLRRRVHALLTKVGRLHPTVGNLHTLVIVYKGRHSV